MVGGVVIVGVCTLFVYVCLSSFVLLFVVLFACCSYFFGGLALDVCNVCLCYISWSLCLGILMCFVLAIVCYVCVASALPSCYYCVRVMLCVLVLVLSCCVVFFVLCMLRC